MPSTRLWASILFIVLVFVMGGGARADLQSLVLLRPISVLFLLYACAICKVQDLRSVKWPLVMLASLGGWMAIQLIPLPPELWRSLPGHQITVDIESAIGMQSGWRPISMSPAKTLNSLMSLIVPMTMLLLYSIQSDTDRRRLWYVFAALIAMSGLLGLLQIAGPDKGPLYFYRITNSGSPVGLFANRNHQAVVLAFLLPVATLFILVRSRRQSGPELEGIGLTIILGLAMVIVPLLLLTGSRAGLMAGALALVAAIAIFRIASRNAGKRVEKADRTGWRFGAPIVVGSALPVTVALAIYFERAIALDRLLGDDPQGGIRTRVLPVLGQMIEHFFPVGAGFGSFEHVYRQFEPDDLLSEFYLNQAHNDWAQALIEGGLPVMILLVAAGAWLFSLGKSILASLRAGHGRPAEELVALSIVLIIGVASLADYPLRVPSVMVLFAYCCAVLSAEAGRPHGPPGRALERVRG
ncbi:O-antigen ligase family protein [Blastomonas fulva]|uniref:O-antigen ligase family protein n=1 Tax=Blastomonas fulva TaxID=1550728 RepID=UPI0026D62088